MSTTNWMEKTIVPKSDQLNAEDLLTGPLTVTVTGVREGSADQPMAIDISGPRKLQPYKPCKTMRRVLIAVWGKDKEGADWVGRKMTLFCDPNVKWAGEPVGGIRISHMSGITEQKTLKLTETRGKRATVIIHPLGDSVVKKPSKLFEKYKPKIKSAPPEVIAIAEKILSALNNRTAGFMTTLESEFMAISDDKWQEILRDFAGDVAAEIDAGG